MIKNFKSELDIMESNKNINEKLMVFSLYNEFYNSVLGSENDSFISLYVSFMERTFRLVVAGLNLQDNVSVNAEEFMKMYFSLLKTSNLSNMTGVANVISHFENELSDFIQVSGYVNAIDKFESIPLDVKVNIMAEFREYINNMYASTIELYGEKNSKEFRHSILNMLSAKLEEYIKQNLNEGIHPINLTDNLKPKMVESTKDYLMDKLRNGELVLDNFENEFVKQFLNSLNETEQKIWLMGAVYSIAGYDKLKAKQVEEMCQTLGISKLKLSEIMLSLSIRYLRALKKQMNESDEETHSGDSLNRRKK